MADDKITSTAAPVENEGSETNPEIPESKVGNVVQSQGVTRMEAVYREAKSNRTSLWLVAVSVLHSSVLATVSIATSIISAVSKPFIAKISDITSRPYTYLLTLFYVVGYIIAATCKTISAYVVGEVFVAIGSSGLDLTNDIIVADLTPLEWRGFASSMLSTPFIINTWSAGKIVNAIDKRGQWRWGYGTFAIIMPVALGPAVATLIWFDRKAKKDGIVNLASSNAARRAAAEIAEKDGHEAPRGAIVAPAAEASRSWFEALKHNLGEIDAFGLILLGFGWSHLLLPFSLKTYADHGWQMKWARMPSAPRRLVFNKTFVISIIIDFIYMLAGSIRSLYWSSYVYVGKTWSYQNWVYYGNTLTLALCIAGPIVGLLHRWTHRYKAIQITGLCINLIGMGIMLNGNKATNNTGALVASQILVGFGGSMSVVGSRVASQASAQHQDVALAISLLSLWSKIGSAIGSAIVSFIWSNQMPKQLRQHLPSNATETDVTKLFGSPTSIRTLYSFDGPMRVGAVLAYQRTLYYCLASVVGISVIPLVAACFQTNFSLVKSQNAVTNFGNDGLPLAEEERREPPKNKKEAFLRFWAGK